MILIRESQNGSIDLEWHPTLRTFPLGRVRSNLWLWGCTSLRSLPDAFEVGRTLDLEGCASLTRLPATLRVGGNLRLRDTAVSELPKDLEVEWGLYLRGSKVTHVPKSARIRGHVHGLGEP